MAYVAGAAVLLDALNKWQASNAQDAANEQNVKNSDAQFRANVLLGQIARGQPYSWDQSQMPGSPQFPQGTPVHQPYYSGTNEIDAYNRANDIFQTTNQKWGSPGQMIQSYTDIANQSKPAIQYTTKSMNDLFSGARTQQRLSEQAPVNQARINTAAAQRSSVYQNLQARLNELKAKQANQGFVGSSTFDKSTQLREAMPFLQESSNVMSAAKLQNALDEQNIRNQDWNTALANINVPYELANKNIAFEQMPALNAVSGFNQAYGVYSPFMLEQYQPPGIMQMPQVQPVLSALGSTAGVGSDFLQSYLKDQAAKQAADQVSDQNQSWQNTMLELSRQRNATTGQSNNDLWYQNGYMP